MKKCIYKENAITLIALVITIIILLILAGITISMSLGENGIITQANNAKKSTQESQEKENFSLEISEYMMESTSLDDLYNKLIDNTSYKKVKKITDPNGTTQQLEVSKNSYTFYIDNNMNISSQKNNTPSITSRTIAKIETKSTGTYDASITVTTYNPETSEDIIYTSISNISNKRDYNYFELYYNTSSCHWAISSKNNNVYFCDSYIDNNIFQYPLLQNEVSWHFQIEKTIYIVINELPITTSEEMVGKIETISTGDNDAEIKITQYNPNTEYSLSFWELYRNNKIHLFKDFYISYYSTYWIITNNNPNLYYSTESDTTDKTKWIKIDNNISFDYRSNICYYLMVIND